MKFFGGGSHKNGGTGDRKEAAAPRKAEKPVTNYGGEKQAEPPIVYFGSDPAKTAPKPNNKTKYTSPAPAKGNKKRNKKVLILALVLALVFVGSAAAAAWYFVRPPEPKNDPTIKDPENGDQVKMNSLLNSGTRIDDVFTFVVGAVDEDETRTDALMVATMDTKQKTINVLNIPRDTMCNNGEGESWRKINAAYGMKKGIEQTKIEIERIMGFQPDKYVIVNFDGIAAVVDAIGGIEYEVPFRMEYSDPSQNLDIDLYAGNQTLDGKKTVDFLRWRHNNDYSMQYPNGDEGRVENQQKFLKAVAKQVLKLENVTKIKDITNAVFENVKTDFTAGELLWMGMQAVQINNDNIQFFTLPGYGQMSTAGSSLALSFFFPYEKETLELVNKYFNPYEEPITELDIVSGPEGGYSAVSPSSGGDDDYVWGDTSGESSGSSGGDGYISNPSYEDYGEGYEGDGGYEDDGYNDGSGSDSENGYDGGGYDDDTSGDYGDDYGDDTGGDYEDDGGSDDTGGDDYEGTSGGDDGNYEETGGDYGDDENYSDPEA